MTWNFLDNLDVNPKNSHLAFERLKILNRLASLEFDEFLLHLRALNPVLTLRNIALQLDEAAENYEGLESDTSDIENIITYLNCIKVNEKQFVERLKQLLS
jgi:phosphoenolpyruvate carboxylase